MCQFEMMIQRVLHFSDDCTSLKRTFEQASFMTHHVPFHCLLRLPFLRAFRTGNYFFPPLVYVKTVPFQITICLERFVTLMTWENIVLWEMNSSHMAFVSENVFKNSTTAFNWTRKGSIYPLCLATHLSELDLSLNFFPQSSHWKSFASLWAFAWVFECWYKPETLLNAIGHVAHLCGFSLLCLFIVWYFKSLTSKPL